MISRRGREYGPLGYLLKANKIIPNSNFRGGIFQKCLVFVFSFSLTIAMIGRYASKEGSLIPLPYFRTTFPEHFRTNGVSEELIPLQRIEQFYSYLNQTLVPCHKRAVLGGRGTDGRLDGQKMICIEGALGLVPGKCVIVSFGVDDDWSVEDSLGNYGCKVYAFDPTMGLEDHNRSNNIHFYNLGVSNYVGALYSDNKKASQKVDRYENILKSLNLTNTVINYLKMNAEDSEFSFLDDIFRTSPQLLLNIHQIGMAIHPGEYTGNGLNPDGRFEVLWKYFQLLEVYGFQLMFAERSREPENYFEYGGEVKGTSYEVVWVRTDLLFK